MNFENLYPIFDDLFLLSGDNQEQNNYSGFIHTQNETFDNPVSTSSNNDQYLRLWSLLITFMDAQVWSNVQDEVK